MIIHAVSSAPEATTSDAISAAAAQVAHTLSAAAIICYTMSGSTALRAARERPDASILVLTNKSETAQRLPLAWGVHCVQTADVSNTREMVAKACRIAVDEGFATAGDSLIVTAGVPFGTPGTTNLLRIVTLD
jgi:pyruvate kinase